MGQFMPNIATKFNPFNCKDYDLSGNEVEETYWLHYVPTGNKLTKREIEEYATMNVSKYSILENEWKHFCLNLLKSKK